MGFMDKAKKLAEQAQQKIDETQKAFNEGKSDDKPQGSGVRYDDHGRPIEGSGAEPAAQGTSATEGASAEGAPAAAPATEGAPPAEPPDRDRPGSGSGGPPDPFKPLQ